MEQALLAADAASLAAIAQRIREQIDDVALAAVRRYRDEIIDYATVDDDFLHGEVLDLTREHLRVFVDNLERGIVLRAEQLDSTRESAARRVHQGISLDSLQQAFRLLGEEVWKTTLASARDDDPDELHAAVQAAGQVMRHVTLVSTAVAQAYLDEAEGVWRDREVLSRDVLEAVVGGRGDTDATRARARALGVTLHDDYAVVVAHPEESHAERAVLRHALDTARTHLRTPAGGALVGLREGELIALCPVDGATALAGVKEGAAALASALTGEGIAVGVSGWHPGADGVAAAYGEAREAAEIAGRTGVRGRAVCFDEVLIEHVLRSSPYADRLLTDALGPLRAYDDRRGSELIQTLRAYFETGYNVTRSAQRLCVHPNTVVYRLRRIKDLTGRDPNDPDDLLLLTLGLKLAASDRPG